jgi:hypothetical protein
VRGIARAAGGYRSLVTEHDDTSTARSRDAAQGYPEEGPPGTGIDARDHPEDDVTPDEDAPQTSASRDGDPSQATGNPKAAGG